MSKYIPNKDTPIVVFPAEFLSALSYFHSIKTKQFHFGIGGVTRHLYHLDIASLNTHVSQYQEVPIAIGLVENNTVQETTTPTPPLEGGELVVITRELSNSNKTLENQDPPIKNQASIIREKTPLLLKEGSGVVNSLTLINTLNPTGLDKPSLENNAPQETTTPTPPLEGGEFVVITRELSDSNKTLENQDSPIKNQASTIHEPTPLLLKEGSGVVEKLALNNLPELETFRRELRRNLTPAEAKFWTLVQHSRLDGRKFRRQHSFGKYVLDFYCPSEKLAVELDGAEHFTENGRLYDQERDMFMAFYGIKIIRFENKLVFQQTEWLLEAIRLNFGWSKTNSSILDSESEEGIITKNNGADKKQ